MAGRHDGCSMCLLQRGAGYMFSIVSACTKLGLHQHLSEQWRLYMHGCYLCTALLHLEGCVKGRLALAAPTNTLWLLLRRRCQILSGGLPCLGTMAARSRVMQLSLLVQQAGPPRRAPPVSQQDHTRQGFTFIVCKERLAAMLTPPAVSHIVRFRRNPATGL
jgi:hypothetical protein